jgi:hypothetical protein
MRILWKEWREQRGLVVLAACAGVIWPLIDIVGNYSNQTILFTELGSWIVAGGGATFAVFLAMATGYSDLRQGIDTFWQARPVRVSKVFLIKLLLGMVLLAVTFAIIMTPEICTMLLQGPDRSGRFLPWPGWPAFWTTWPIAALLFGAGLFFMALVRDVAKAAFVTIWFGLLVYFLPLFFNGLKPLNVFERFDNPYHNGEFFRQMVRGIQDAGAQGAIPLIRAIWQMIYWSDLRFLEVSLGGALAFTLLAAHAVRRNWRWQPTQKTIVWTLGASAALVFAVALFQVRSNLRPATSKDGQALVNPMSIGWVEPPLPESLKGHRGFELLRRDIFGSVVHGGHLYTLEDVSFRRADGQTLWDFCGLQSYRFPAGRSPETGASPFRCGGLVVPNALPGSDHAICGFHVWGDRLYVASPRGEYGEAHLCVCDTVDISDPQNPELIGNMAVPWPS